jgi:histidinol-phosphate phosphatase family protein
MYGDTMLNVDLTRLRNAHVRVGSAASLFLHPNDHPADSDLVETDDAGRIVAFHPYPHDPERYYQNLVNAALYVISRDALQRYRDWSGPADFGKDLFPRMLADGLHLHGYRSREYIKDAGTPERMDRVIADYLSGKIERGSLRTPAPAVFLDRDGTLNREVNLIRRPEQLALLDGAAEAVKRVNRAGIRTVVITNQPVIARGDCDEAGLRAIHNKLETELGRRGAYLDAIYYCPHHPHAGYPGERPELKFACSCRKPAAGLIFRAKEEMNLDLARSWLIGDSTTDLKTAANAGVRSILVETGHAGLDGVHAQPPDYIFPDLGAAVDFLLGSAGF